VPLGILGIDPEGRVLHCNETAAVLLKVPAEALKGRPWTEVLPEMFRPFVEKLVAEGVFSAYDPIGGRRGWIKGSTVDLEPRQGLVLVFDWEPEALPANIR
jgi:PAS domain-containing protein